jgi:putative sterol carrier protein
MKAYQTNYFHDILNGDSFFKGEYKLIIDLDVMKVDDIWNKIRELLNANPEPLEGMNTTYSFELTGEDGGQYGLKIYDNQAEVIVGEVSDVDCALTMSVSDFKKLLVGNLNSTASFMMGKLKVKGNIGLALKLESLLKKYTFE